MRPMQRTSSFFEKAKQAAEDQGMSELEIARFMDQIKQDSIVSE